MRHADHLNHAFVVIAVEGVFPRVGKLLDGKFFLSVLGVFSLHVVVSTEVLTDLLVLVLGYCDVIVDADFFDVSSRVRKDATGIVTECSAFTLDSIAMIVRRVCKLTICGSVSSLASQSHKVAFRHRAYICDPMRNLKERGVSPWVLTQLRGNM